jgi:hypothetical protein
MACILRATWLAVFALAIFAAGPNPATQHQRPAGAKSGATPRLSDAQIEAAIRAKLAKSKIGADGFTVRVQGGVATFEGRTDVVQHKGAATRMAKAAGAVAVNNRIQVSDAARKRAAANLQTGRRRVQVKRGEPRSQDR